MDSAKKGEAGDIIAVLRGLRQVRQFRPDPVPEGIITAILEVARWTGSGMNRQPWEFLLVRDAHLLGELSRSDNAGSHLAGAQFALVVIMAGQMPEIETYDEGRLTERVMLAAAAQGVGAGIWWFKDEGVGAKKLLGIPEGRRVRTAVAFGYPLASAGTVPKPGDGRKPLDALVHVDHY